MEILEGNDGCICLYFDDTERLFKTLIVSLLNNAKFMRENHCKYETELVARAMNSIFRDYHDKIQEYLALQEEIKDGDKLHESS